MPVVDHAKGQLLSTFATQDENELCPLFKCGLGKPLWFKMV